MGFANYTNFEKKRHVVSMKTTRRFVENDTLFYRKRHVVFLMPSRRIFGEYFLLPFSAHLQMAERCFATKTLVMRQENRNFAKLYLFTSLLQRTSLHQHREHLFISTENISSTVQRVAIHQHREHLFYSVESSHSSA